MNNALFVRIVAFFVLFYIFTPLSATSWSPTLTLSESSRGIAQSQIAINNRPLA